MTDSRNASSDLHAALNAEEDSVGLVDAVKDNLEIVVQKRDEMLETLSPIVRKRVEELERIQSQHDALMAKLFKEMTALEDKYQKLYEPLYTKRYEIVNGIAEVEGITDESEANSSEGITDGSEANSSEEKGVPGFWLNTMNQNQVLAEEIQERDEKALKYLKDIKWSRLVEPGGFKLEFFFETNPFFKNTVLTKTYHMLDLVYPLLKKVIGTEIEWFPGKCLTQKTLMKKSRMGLGYYKPTTKTLECDSFFNFFKPPEIPNDDSLLDDDTADQVQNLMEADYGLGSLIKDKLIPHAVRWFTGQAVQYDLDIRNADEYEDEENIGGDQSDRLDDRKQ